MKKRIATILAFSMMLSLAACSKKEGGTSGENKLNRTTGTAETSESTEDPTDTTDVTDPLLPKSLMPPVPQLWNVVPVQEWLLPHRL